MIRYDLPLSWKLLSGLGMLLVALPTGLSAQTGTVVLASVEVAIPALRHVEVSSSELNTSCGQLCRIVTLEISANADWSLQIDAPDETTALTVEAMAPQLTRRAASSGSVIVRGGRGGEQMVTVRVVGASDPTGVRYSFVQD